MAEEGKTEKKLVDIKPYMPPYIKPYREFQKNVRKGDYVKLKVISLQSNSIYGLKDVEGEVNEVATNCVYIKGRFLPIPWFAIHDWEIVK